MSYVLKPSLEHIVLVNLAATLWNQDDVKNLLAKFCIPSNYRQFKSKWVKLEAKTEKKVAKLPLPKRLKEKIVCFIRPVGFQIARWRQFHDIGCNVSVDLPNEFSWTPQGTIDKKKTAEVMIKDESIDIVTRYKLACTFCLEDDIPKLWEKISRSRRKFFYSEEYPTELVVFWTAFIKGQVGKMNRMIEQRMRRRCSPYQYAFELVAIDGNRVATEYFLQKLTAAEREESLVKTAASVALGHTGLLDEQTGFLRETYSEILCFLLSQLDKTQQLEVFKRHPSQVLACFLDWPLQSFFIETANCMWNFLPKIFYQYIFSHFTAYIIEGYKDFNYRKLFREFWEQSPHDYKRYVLSGNIICCVISDLFKIRDEGNIKLILQEATPEDKKGIIYGHNSLEICRILLCDNQRHLLKYFIKECLPSKDEVVEFKNYYIANVFHVSEFYLRKFLRWCSEIICEFNKRKSVEDDECSKAKRM